MKTGLLNIAYTLALLIGKVVCLFNSIIPRKYQTIIIRRDRIGDFIIWLGCIQKYRTLYPDQNITLICSKSNYGIAKLSGVFDRIIILERNQILKVFGMHCDRLISPELSRMPLNEIITSCISAKEKITIEGMGASNPFYGNRIEKNMYTKIIPNPPEGLSEIEINTYFYNHLCEKNEEAIYADLSRFKGKQIYNKPYYVINLGASTELKRWPVDRFSQIAVRINELKDYICILVGGKDEIQLGIEFEKSFVNGCENLIGKTSLEELISIIYGAEFVLTNDTSTVHISAACSVKCFCVVWGAYFGRLTGYPASHDYREIPEYIICEKMNCFGCVLDDPYRNMIKECQEKYLKDQGVVQCLLNVQVEDVVKRISNYISNIK